MWTRRIRDSVTIGSYMKWRTLAAILCLINWAAFLSFLILRDPVIEQEREIEYLANGTVFRPLPSGHPESHIAGRPLHTWSSWHGGERPFIKITEVVNYPALIAATAVARPLTALLFQSSRTYYLESWIRAWVFLFAASLQWIGVAWVASKIGDLIWKRQGLSIAR